LPEGRGFLQSKKQDFNNSYLLNRAIEIDSAAISVQGDYFPECVSWEFELNPGQISG